MRRLDALWLAVLGIGVAAAALAIFVPTASAQCASGPPPNDCFVNSVTVTGTPSTMTQSNVGATTEPGEPSPCATIGTTIWYSWTPSFGGNAVINTWGSGWDTTIAAYTGTSVSALSNVACNDDDFAAGGCNCLQSRIQFTCTPGTTYMIQAGGWNSNTGTAIINLSGCNGAPVCSPATQNVPIGATASLSAVGVSPYTWSAPGSSNPGPVTGSAWAGTYATMGAKTVTVSNSNGSNSCTVNVTPPPGCGYTVNPVATYDWVELAPSGTPGPPWDDTPLSISAPFPFTFCGTTYSGTWRLGPNGMICFGTSGGCSSWTPGALPSASRPRPAVFGYWTDIYPPGCSSTCTFYSVQGTAPNRVFIYEEKDINFFPQAAPGPLTFEIKLFETTNCIEVHYKSVSSTSNAALAGYQDAAGGAAYTYAFTSPGFARTQQAWSACPIPPFTATADAYVFNEDQSSHALPVLANDINAVGGPITITSVGAASKGTATLSGGVVSYVPWLDKVGADSFTYSILNQDGQTSTGTVSITINAVNDAPSFAGGTNLILATPGQGTRVVPGWGSNVRPAPATATDEAGQGITFVVVSNSNAGIFAQPPLVQRTGSASDVSPMVPPTAGGHALLRFAPSGNSGMSTVCFRAQDSGGTATVTNTWGETATGFALSPAQCVDILENASPVAFFQPSTATAAPGEGITFNPCPAPVPNCSHDPDGAIVQYLWEFGDGMSSAMVSPRHTYTTPGAYAVRLTVWDNHGVMAVHTLTVYVVRGEGDPVDGDAADAVPPPTPDAGGDRTVLEGTEVRLAGTQKGGDTSTSYTWTQVAGPKVSLTEATTPTPTFNAPMLPTMAPVDLVFGLRLAQGAAVSPSDYVVIHVVSGNHAPMAEAGDTVTAHLGEQVRLDGRGSSDADNDALTYRWEQQMMPGELFVPLAGADTAEPSFTAPRHPGLLHFRLTVSDGKAVSVDHVTVEVRPLLQASELDGTAGQDARATEARVAAAPVGARVDWMPVLWAGALLLTIAAGVVAFAVRKLR